jgi:hypothetical protein
MAFDAALIYRYNMQDMARKSAQSRVANVWLATPAKATQPNV